MRRRRLLLYADQQHPPVFGRLDQLPPGSFAVSAGVFTGFELLHELSFLSELQVIVRPQQTKKGHGQGRA